MNNREFQKLLESKVIKVFDNSDKFIKRFYSEFFTGDIDKFHMGGHQCRVETSNYGIGVKSNYFLTIDVLDWLDEL